MTAISIAFFDRLAESYDETWTNTPAGRLQRNAVWRVVDRLIHSQDRILDLGCGTGEDALHFRGLGGRVDAIDGSQRMIDAARRRGIDARRLRIEEINALTGEYDLVFSNFGALNCVKNLAALREPLSRLIRPGGNLAICILNRFCAWETVHYGLRGQFKKASRRWSGEAVSSSGLRVFYPAARAIERLFQESFRLVRDIGVGIAVPPSYVSGITPKMLDKLGQIDTRIAGSIFGRVAADHRLLIFTRSR